MYKYILPQSCEKVNAAGKKDEKQVVIIFNRDILINEKEAIDGCKASVGILSNETIVEQHPWVKNPKTELDRIKKEKKEEMKAFEDGYGSVHKTGENAGDGG